MGVEPVGCHDQEDNTVLIFDRELSEQEKQRLDSLMNNDPTFPPKSKTIFRIVDIGEKLDWFNEQCGIGLRLFCSGNERTDVLELHTEQELTEEQKQKVKQVFSNLIS